MSSILPEAAGLPMDSLPLSNSLRLQLGYVCMLEFLP